MKSKSHVNCVRAVLFASSIVAAHSVIGQTVLSSGHVDIGIGFEEGVFDLHIHDEGADAEFEPGEAILQVGGLARTIVPSDARFNFLGTPGSSVWVLSQNQNPNLLFLGLGAEEVESGLFTDDELKLTLKGVSGPGDFIVYSTSGVAGNPVLRMNSRDGVSDLSDFATLLAGGHGDFNWAFTAPGDYTVTFEASGTLQAGGGLIASGPIDYRFQVIPEPGTWALMGTGLIMAGIVMRRKAGRQG